MSIIDEAIPLPTKPIEPVVMSQEKSTISKIYRSAFPACMLVFPNGKPAHFLNHRFVTDVASEIEFLDAEIARGNQGLYVDPTDAIIEAPQDLLAGLKAKWEAEFLAKQAAAVAGDFDAGTSKPDANLGMGNSSGISKLAAGSASGASLMTPQTAPAPVLGIKIK